MNIVRWIMIPMIPITRTIIVIIINIHLLDLPFRGVIVSTGSFPIAKGNNSISYRQEGHIVMWLVLGGIVFPHASKQGKW